MTYLLKIQLKNVAKPPVWRKIEIDPQMTFYQLHGAIQGAMGWENAHLFNFSPTAYSRELQISIPRDDDFGFVEVTDCRETQIGQYINEYRKKMVYTYDFGDNWQHEVTLEKVLDKPSPAIPQCVGGKGMCPPDDCGGAWSFENFKNKVEELQKTVSLYDVMDEDSPNYDEELAWILDMCSIDEDGKIDFKEFDIEEAEARIEDMVKWCDTHCDDEDFSDEGFDIGDDEGFDFDPFEASDGMNKEDEMYRMRLEVIKSFMEKDGHEFDVDAFIAAEKKVDSTIENLVNQIKSNPDMLNLLMGCDDDLSSMLNPKRKSAKGKNKKK